MQKFWILDVDADNLSHILNERGLPMFVVWILIVTLLNLAERM